MDIDESEKSALTHAVETGGESARGSHERLLLPDSRSTRSHGGITLSLARRTKAEAFNVSESIILVSTSGKDNESLKNEEATGHGFT